MPVRASGALLALCCLLAVCTRVHPLYAYAPLTHEAIVDAAWDDGIVPVLRKKFPGATEEEITGAHAYAYGGCIIQDSGYFPHGSAFFTDLMHYVRTGDFASALLQDAFTIEEYAFALGALEHYYADQIGHSQATNHAVPIEFPKLQRHFDSWVTYEDDPFAHLKVEFEFDVLQVARGRYAPEAHRAFIGFAVAKELLDRTFYRIYGVPISSLMNDEALAIGTYRYAVANTIPEATKIAWELKKDEIEKAMPGIQRNHFIYSIPRHRYEQEWGTKYERPGALEKIAAFFLRFLPKVGLLRVLEVKPLAPESERLFEASFAATVDRYRAALQQLPGPLSLPDVNLDTGQPARLGTYKLADETYGHLIMKLRDNLYYDVTPELHRNILAYYDDLHGPKATTLNAERGGLLASALWELRAFTPPKSLLGQDSTGHTPPGR